MLGIVVLDLSLFLLRFLVGGLRIVILRLMLMLIFLAVVEHRLIPARVLASVWAPALQEASHVGHADGASVSLPSIATVQCQRFFDCGRAVRCVLPFGGGRVMHLIILYGFQGADRDP